MRMTWATAMVAVTLTLVACDRPTPFAATQSDVPGTWVAEACGSQLVLDDDGTLTATKLQTGYDSPVDGSGTWTFTDALTGVSSFGVEVTVGQTSTALYFVSRDGKPVLLDIVGDPDDGRACNFTRA